MYVTYVCLHVCLPPACLPACLPVCLSVCLHVWMVFFLKVFSCCLFGKLFEAYALHVQLAVASEEVHFDGVFVLVNLGRTAAVLGCAAVVACVAGFHGL